MNLSQQTHFHNILSNTQNSEAQSMHFLKTGKNGNLHGALCDILETVTFFGLRASSIFKFWVKIDSGWGIKANEIESFLVII